MPPVGKSGPLMCLHQLVVVDVAGSSMKRDRRGDHLAQVVRRDVRRHADGDAGRAVDEQVREARRQHERLLRRRRRSWARSRRCPCRGRAASPSRERRQARLGVPHGGGGIVVDGAEVALAVDERVAHREVLRHAHERVVDRRVAVRVVLAHHLADDAGALRVRRGSARGPALVHREQHAAVDGLQAVADVGQRAPDDDATSRSRGTRCASPPRARGARCCRQNVCDAIGSFLLRP